MVTADSVKDKICGLINTANATTGKTDVDLTTAVNSLVEGFGQGNEDAGFKMMAEIFNQTCVEFCTDAVTEIKIARSFENNIALTTVSLPELVSITGGYNFSGCISLQTVNMPKVQVIQGMSTFANCAIETVIFPQAAQINSQSMFQNCTKLRKVVFPKKERGSGIASHFSSFGQKAFSGCSALTEIVIGFKDSIASLISVNTFDGTPFASDGTGGTVYVPEALIPEYQQATNWSTLYAAGTCTFLPIEGSEYE
jgi:hypothetical protein